MARVHVAAYNTLQWLLAAAFKSAQADGKV